MYAPVRFISSVNCNTIVDIGRFGHGTLSACIATLSRVLLPSIISELSRVAKYCTIPVDHIQNLKAIKDI